MAVSGRPASTASADPLGVLAEAGARTGDTWRLASRHLDPSLVEMLAIIGFDTEYAAARGSHLYDVHGRAYLDFHTGEGFASLGHNHPEVRQALQATLAAGGPIHSQALSSLLAEELCARLPGRLESTRFTATGAEAVDAAMQLARAATGRPRLLACESGYHGVTLGPLSLVGDEFLRAGFGPLLPGCDLVPHGDLDRLEAELRAGDVAGFLVEPIQGRQVTPPPDGYLRAAQELCRRHGTLLIADEVQTGLGRTGAWFALEHFGIEPDVVIVGKALSGGYMPVAATVSTRAVSQAVGTRERGRAHEPANALSMAAGLATLRIIERDGLVEHARSTGERLRAGLTELQGRYEMIREVRGRGLMVGIELQAPRGPCARLSWRLIHVASGGLFPQLIVIPLHRDHGVITMAAGKNDVIKLLPPLTLSADELAWFLEALDAVLADVHARSGPHGRSWGVVREIATRTLTHRAQAHAR